jgi:hypothetical protein
MYKIDDIFLALCVLYWSPSYKLASSVPVTYSVCRKEKNNFSLILVVKILGDYKYVLVTINCMVLN